MENIQIKQIQYPHVIDIDISKMSIDVAVIDTNSLKSNTALFSNDSEGFKKMKKGSQRFHVRKFKFRCNYCYVSGRLHILC